MEMQREALLSAIRTVLPAVSKKEHFDQANKMVFVSGKVVAFDDAVAILHPLNLDVEAGGLDLEGAFDGQKLCDLLARFTTDTVDLTYGDERLNVRSGRSRATFDLLPVRLPIDSIDMSGEMVDLPDGFIDQLDWVRASCAKGTSRPVLSCVLIKDGWMLASDSYRVSRVRYGDADLPRLLLSNAQIAVLLDHPIKRVALSDGGEWARFETDFGTVLCARSMSSEFPNVSHVLDVQGRELGLTTSLNQAIERATVFSKRAEEINEEVQIDMRAGHITVSAQCDGAEFAEDVECDGAEEGVGFSMNPKFLAAALKSGTRCVLGDDKAKFWGTDWEHVVALRVARSGTTTG